FPELAALVEPMADESSPWSRAERHLREWRNRHSHLQRLPESEVHMLSDGFAESLRVLLKTASFVSTFPLVYVVDYELNPVSSERVATFHLLQGISPVFPRTRQ